MKRYCLALDLKDDPALIADYEKHHRTVWPEIIESIRNAGVENMEIYRLGNRLFMVMEVDETFDFDRKAKMDASNPKVQEWEEFMWKYQQRLPQSKAGEKWLLMDNIFRL